MKVPEAALRFPVLGFTTDLDVWGFADVEILTTCGVRTLRDDMQIGMELVDAEGRRWVVRSVRRVARIDPVLFRPLARFLGGAQYRVEQDVEPAGTMSLQQVRDKVCAGIEAHPDFWRSHDEDETEVPARVAEVRAVTAIGDIPSLLGLDDFRSY